MKTQSLDTSPEVEKLHFDMMRRAGDGARAAAMRSMSAFLINSSRQTLADSHPEWSEQEVMLQWVARCYGEELARSVRLHLEKVAL